ncbi:hypothetical protein ABK040_003572 [Willaertia magna]
MILNNPNRKQRNFFTEQQPPIQQIGPQQQVIISSLIDEEINEVIINEEENKEEEEATILTQFIDSPIDKFTEQFIEGLENSFSTQINTLNITNANNNHTKNALPHHFHNTNFNHTKNNATTIGKKQDDDGIQQQQQYTKLNNLQNNFNHLQNNSNQQHTIMTIDFNQLSKDEKNKILQLLSNASNNELEVIEYCDQLSTPQTMDNDITTVIYKPSLPNTTTNVVINNNTIPLRNSNTINNNSANNNNHTISSNTINSSNNSIKKRSLEWALRIIDDIYNNRYQCFLNEIQTNTGSLESFSSFVFNHLSKKLGLDKLIKQTTNDLLETIKFYKNINKEMELFGLFLTPYYNVIDLMFFLFCRSQIINECIVVNEKSTFSLQNSLQKNNSLNNKITFINKKKKVKLGIVPHFVPNTKIGYLTKRVLRDQPRKLIENCLNELQKRFYKKDKIEMYEYLITILVHYKAFREAKNGNNYFYYNLLPENIPIHNRIRNKDLHPYIVLREIKNNQLNNLQLNILNNNPIYFNNNYLMKDNDDDDLTSIGSEMSDRNLFNNNYTTNKSGNQFNNNASELVKELGTLPLNDLLENLNYTNEFEKEMELLNRHYEKISQNEAPIRRRNSKLSTTSSLSSNSTITSFNNNFNNNNLNNINVAVVNGTTTNNNNNKKELENKVMSGLDSLNLYKDLNLSDKTINLINDYNENSDDENSSDKDEDEEEDSEEESIPIELLDAPIDDIDDEYNETTQNYKQKEKQYNESLINRLKDLNLEEEEMINSKPPPISPQREDQLKLLKQQFGARLKNLKAATTTTTSGLSTTMSTMVNNNDEENNNAGKFNDDDSGVLMSPPHSPTFNTTMTLSNTSSASINNSMMSINQSLE